MPSPSSGYPGSSNWRGGGSNGSSTSGNMGRGSWGGSGSAAGANERGGLWAFRQWLVIIFIGCFFFYNFRVFSGSASAALEASSSSKTAPFSRGISRNEPMTTERMEALRPRIIVQQSDHPKKTEIQPPKGFDPTFTLLTKPLPFAPPEPEDIIDFPKLMLDPKTKLPTEDPIPKVDRSKRRVFVVSMFDSTPSAREVIPYFLDHYHGFLGIPMENILITIQSINTTTDLQWKIAYDLLKSYGATVGIIEGEYNTFLNQIATQVWWKIVPFTIHDWLIHADMDELFWYPHNLWGMIDIMEDRGWTFLPGGFVDRVKANGALEGLLPFSDDGPTIWEQYPMDCNLNTVTQGTLNYNKVALHRAFLVPVRGHHGTNSTVPPHVGAPEGLRVPAHWRVHGPDYLIPTYHFKWTDNARRSIEERIENYKRIKIPWYQANERWLKHLVRNNWKICVRCLEVTDCHEGFNPRYEESQRRKRIRRQREQKQAEDE